MNSSSILHENLIPRSDKSSCNSEQLDETTRQIPNKDESIPTTTTPRDIITMTGPAQTIAGILGNVLEWYDFALFGFFSDIIGQVFFPPSENGGSNLVNSFAIYGCAFVMRPIGGMLIGNVGDKYGRRRGLVLSLFLMAIPTFAMGCLPTYEQVGILSTVLLIFCRLLQGMSVGGQLPASMIYTIEKKPKERWGFYGALVLVAANVGTILGNFIGALLRTIMTDEELVTWGWRIPFWSGLLIAFVAIYLRLYGEEHNPNEDEYGNSFNSQDGNGGETRRPKYPLREAFRRKNLPALISATLTPMLGGSSFYLTFVWTAIYMESLMTPPIKHAFWINSLALIFGVTIPLPILGTISDRTGRIPIMIFGVVCMGVFAPLLLMVISTHGSTVVAFFAQFGIGLMLTCYSAPITAFLIEMFPPKIRLTSAAVGYDMAQSTASAFTPLIATVLLQNYGSKAPGLIYPFFAVLSLIGIVTGKAIREAGIVENETNKMRSTLDNSRSTEESKEETQLNPIV